VASDFEIIFRALETAGVRYLVVGGVAVVLHGHARFTADLDLFVALDTHNVRAALTALERLGYRPRAPVLAEQFADATLRKQWIETKGMTVFSLASAAHPLTEVDLFVEEPIPFAEAFERACFVDLGGTAVPVIGMADLIELKRRADRPRDREDIEALRALAPPGGASRPETGRKESP
jgi:hypothetical protein